MRRLCGTSPPLLAPGLAVSMGSRAYAPRPMPPHVAFRSRGCFSGRPPRLRRGDPCLGSLCPLFPFTCSVAAPPAGPAAASASGSRCGATRGVLLPFPFDPTRRAVRPPPFRTVSGVRTQVLVGLRPSHTRVRPLFSCAAPWVAPPSQVGSWRRAALLIPPEDASWLASSGGVIILLRIILIIILIIIIIGMMTIIILMLQHGRRGVGLPLVLLYGRRGVALLSWVHALLPSR